MRQVQKSSANPVFPCAGAERGVATCAGLDLSLTGAGVAVLKTDGSVVSKTFGYGLTKDATERDQGDRIISITNSIIGFLKPFSVRYIGLENYAFSTRNPHFLSRISELGGVVKLQLRLNFQLVPLVVPATSVRRFLLGKSTNDKKVVEDFLRQLGHTTPKTADEFDALAVAKVVDAWANHRSAVVDDHRLEVLERLDYQRSRVVAAAQIKKRGKK